MEWLQIPAIKVNGGPLQYLLEADTLDDVVHHGFRECVVIVAHEVYADSLLGDDADEHHEFEAKLKFSSDVKCILWSRIVTDLSKYSIAKCCQLRLVRLIEQEKHL